MEVNYELMDRIRSMDPHIADMYHNSGTNHIVLVVDLDNQFIALGYSCLSTYQHHLEMIHKCKCCKKDALITTKPARVNKFIDSDGRIKYKMNSVLRPIMLCKSCYDGFLILYRMHKPRYNGKVDKYTNLLAARKLDIITAWYYEYYTTSSTLDRCNILSNKHIRKLLAIQHFVIPDVFKHIVWIYWKLFYYKHLRFSRTILSEPITTQESIFQDSHIIKNNISILPLRFL